MITYLGVFSVDLVSCVRNTFAISLAWKLSKLRLILTVPFAQLMIRRSVEVSSRKNLAIWPDLVAVKHTWRSVPSELVLKSE